MGEYFSNKIDFIIMIVLALMVAFIIGFNILQLIDSKLNSVVINVPSTSSCDIPPIYLSVDKNSNIKQLKLNDLMDRVSDETENNIEQFETENNENNENKESNEDMNNEDMDKIENFGNLHNYPAIYNDNRRHLISSVATEPKANNTINQKTIYETATDPNFNTVGDIPLLFAPDTDVPNRAGSDSKGYYSSKVKLVENQNSPLMKLATENKDKINKVVAQCSLADSKKIPQINGTFDGYNAFADLRTDSYANITSIGKSMLSPYTSYPVPS
jgi:hypothetical protein